MDIFSAGWLQNCRAGKFSASEYAQTKVQYLLHLKLPAPKYYRRMFLEFRGVFESMLLSMESMESLKDVPRVLR